MRAAPHFPKCKCADCRQWRAEMHAAHDQRERDRDRLPTFRVPRGWLDAQQPSAIFEHDLETA